MKQLEVQIMGQSYLLGCPEGGDTRLLEAVERVDSAMCKIRDAGKVRARDRIAVLAALNLAFDLSDKPVAAAKCRCTSVPTRCPVLPALKKMRVTPHLLLTSLLERLDEALGEDGRLL